MENNNKHLVDFGREFTSKIDIHTAIIDIVRMMADLTEALAAEIKRSEALAAELKKAEANDADARCHVAELEARCEALAAEPVYFVEIEGDQDINAGRITGKKRTDLGLLPDGINPLYAVPPAPVVVPDSLAETLIAAIEKEQERLSDEDYLMDSKDCIDVIREEMKHLNACRAAMLQGKAEPVSQPYTLPEGYALVPVDATRAMIDAARCVEEDGYDAMHKAMLAAAPQQEVKP